MLFDVALDVALDNSALPAAAANPREVDAKLAREEKALGDRWTQRELGKHRALLEESRQALSASVAASSRESAPFATRPAS